MSNSDIFGLWFAASWFVTLIVVYSIESNRPISKRKPVVWFFVPAVAGPVAAILYVGYMLAQLERPAK